MSITKRLLVTIAVIAISLGFSVPAFAQSDYDYDFDSSSYDYEYSASSKGELTDEQAAQLMVFITAYSGIIMCVAVVFYIYYSITLMKVANKLGVENAWLAWIPAANLFYIFYVAGLSPWMGLTIFIPFVGTITISYAEYKIAERRGFESMWGIMNMAVINFVPCIGTLVYLFAKGYIAWSEPKKLNYS